MADDQQRCRDAGMVDHIGKPIDLQQLVQTISARQLQHQAARWLDPDKMVIVVVGDAKRLEKSLAELHLPIYRYTSNQAAGI